MTPDQERLAAFLRPRSPYPYCFACLTAELSISERATREAARVLAKLGVQDHRLGVLRLR